MSPPTLIKHWACNRETIQNSWYHNDVIFVPGFYAEHDWEYKRTWSKRWQHCHQEKKHELSRCLTPHSGTSGQRLRDHQSGTCLIIATAVIMWYSYLSHISTLSYKKEVKRAKMMIYSCSWYEGSWSHVDSKLGVCQGGEEVRRWPCYPQLSQALFIWTSFRWSWLLIRVNLIKMKQ